MMITITYGHLSIAMAMMNPAEPASFNHRTERLSTGRTYHFVDQQPANDGLVTTAADVRTILCVHGFPDIW
jgi:soluble epoxide hydrolase/lipid-phosphate phosphatase